MVAVFDAPERAFRRETGEGKIRKVLQPFDCLLASLGAAAGHRIASGEKGLASALGLRVA